MNGKDIFLGLKYVGEDLIQEAEYGIFSQKEKTKTGIRTLSRKHLLIAAIIALMLFLLGCGWVVMKMQDLKIGQTADEQYVFATDGITIIGTETVDQTVLTLAGLEGSAPYKANAEWYACQEALLESANRMEQEGTLPEGYWEKGIYHQELQEKADELAAKYGLKPEGKRIDFHTTRTMCDSLGIERFHTTAEGVVVTVKDGGGYDNGNFWMNMDFSFQDDQQYDVPETWGILRWNRKDSFSRDYVLLNERGDWKEWNYTTASGSDVLILRSDSDLRGYIICQREEALLSLQVEARVDLGYNVDGKTWFDYIYLTDRQMELLADAVDFGIHPKTVTQEDVDRQHQAAASETKNGFVLTLKSVETDGWFARIVVGITAPEGMDIERLDIGTGNTGEELIPAFGQVFGSAAFNDTSDGDGLANTKDLVMDACLHYADGTMPFATGSVWELRIEDLWVDKFRDSEHILTEGAWTFPIVFEVPDGGKMGLELASRPITMNAIVGWEPDGKDIYGEVKVTSFMLSPMGSVIRYEYEGSLEFTKYDMPMYTVMKDGTRVRFLEMGGNPGITWYLLEKTIDTKLVDHILLLDGTKLQVQ